MNKLSVLIIVNNEEKQLENCLKTISFADEIIVVLDKCSDNSGKIAKKYTKNIYSGSWEIEGDRRNYGLQKCKNKWILEIDADERVPTKLRNEILKIIKTSMYDWHLIGVKNFLGNEVINYGWGAYFGKSSYSGLFRNNIKKWGGQRVHPKIIMNGNKGPNLKNKLDHYYCKSISDLITKLDSYSTSRAIDLKDSGSDESLYVNVRRLFSRFWKCFFLRKGYKEKKVGFIIAVVASLYPLVSYLKYKIELDD